MEIEAGHRIWGNGTAENQQVVREEGAAHDSVGAQAEEQLVGVERRIHCEWPCEGLQDMSASGGRVDHEEIAPFLNLLKSRFRTSAALHKSVTSVA